MLFSNKVVAYVLALMASVGRCDVVVSSHLTPANEGADGSAKAKADAIAGLLRGTATEGGARGLKCLKCTDVVYNSCCPCYYATGDQACGSCNNRSACWWAKGDIGPHACGGQSSCTSAKGDIEKNSCGGKYSCRSSEGDIGQNSCGGHKSCYYAKADIGEGSCNAPYACYFASSDIPPNSCNKCAECCEGNCESIRADYC